MTAPIPTAAPTAIAIDVGGTAMKCALVDATGAVRYTERHPTDRDRGPDAVLDTIGQVAAGLVERSKVDGQEPRAVGLVVPGVVDEATGTAVYSSNIGWRDVPLAGLVAARTRLPTVLGHDVRAGGLAEARLGAGAGSDNVLFVAIGTGIAAAHVLAGRAYPGAHGAPSELGHVTVKPGGPRCGCGRQGCLESLASATAVARRYAEAATAASRTGPVAEVPAVQVMRRAADGDPFAIVVWEQAIQFLADGLTVAVRLLDPEVIVLGGGLAEAGDALLDPLATAVADRLAFQTMPRLVRARLGDEAGCVGAALLALDRLAAS